MKRITEKKKLEQLKAEFIRLNPAPDTVANFVSFMVHVTGFKIALLKLNAPALEQIKNALHFYDQRN